MRAKKRYITVEIVASKTSFNRSDIESRILDAVEQLHGVFGRAAVSSLSVRYWNSVTCVCLMSIYFGPHKYIATVLPFIDGIGGESVQINTIFTGATLKRCYLNIQKYEISKLEKLWSSLTTKKERSQFQNFFIDSNIVNYLKENPG